MPQIVTTAHTQTCNLACADLLLNPDDTPKTRSAWSTSLKKSPKKTPTSRIQDFFRTFQDPQNVFSRTLYTARVLLNLLYTASSMANTL